MYRDQRFGPLNPITGASAAPKSCHAVQVWSTPGILPIATATVLRSMYPAGIEYFEPLFYLCIHALLCTPYTCSFPALYSVQSTPDELTVRSTCTYNQQHGVNQSFNSRYSTMSINLSIPQFLNASLSPSRHMPTLCLPCVMIRLIYTPYGVVPHPFPFNSILNSTYSVLGT